MKSVSYDSLQFAELPDEGLRDLAGSVFAMRVSEAVRFDVGQSDRAVTRDDLLYTFPLEVKGKRHFLRRFPGAQMANDGGDCFFGLVSQATSPPPGYFPSS